MEKVKRPYKISPGLSTSNVIPLKRGLFMGFNFLVKVKIHNYICSAEQI